ncbi:MAG: hypothetical protein ABJZ98_02215, partial [Saccharospirillum sp.]
MTQLQRYPIQTQCFGQIEYCPNPQHRNSNPNKSQWTIDIPSELESFQTMDQQEWNENQTGWGLYFNEYGSISYLGTLPRNRAEVFIAKFVCDVAHGLWHGYPADYQSNIQDVPHKEVIFEWVQDEI